ncbi:MAG: glycosyltransferase family 39 protein [Bacteroidales bacterium]|nr:glycosyltransferase family 39 protein [Bacteroidales bacterium]
MKRNTELLSHKNKTLLFVVIYLLLALPVLFLWSGNHPLFIWDESRVAENSLEMMQNGNLIVTTFNNETEHWNTKPPLLNWLQVLSMKIFGISELAVRIPSLIAAILMGITLILFFKRLKLTSVGFLSAIFSLCSFGLVYYHCFRSADYDAMLTFLTLAYTLSFFIYTETEENRYCLLFFLFLCLAFLTKDIQSLIPLPMLIVYVTVRKKLNLIFKNKYFLIGVLLFIIITAGYYLLRENADKGFIAAAFSNNTSGRFTSALENNGGSFFYYFRRVLFSDFVPFSWLVPVSFLINIRSKDSLKKRTFFYFSSVSVFYILIISLSQTKTRWYSAPAIPMLSICATSFFDYLYSYLRDRDLRQRKLILFAALFVLCLPPYTINIINIRNQTFKREKEFYSGIYLMKDLAEGKIKYDNVFYLKDKQENEQNSVFYFNLLKTKGKHIYLIDSEEIKEGMIVQINRKLTQKLVKEKWEYKKLCGETEAEIVEIKKHKTSEQETW